MGQQRKWYAGIAFMTVTVLALVVTAVPVLAAGNLVGYWKFDEASGTTAADSSGNGNDGTYTGSGVVASPTVVAPIVCMPNPNSVSFDGSGGYVSVPDNGTTMDPANQITITLWVNPNTINNGYQHVVFKQGPVVTSYGIWLIAGGQIYFETNDNSIHGMTSNTSLTAGAWHYITVTYDGTTQKVYLDGVLDNSASLPGITLSYQNSPLKIGSGDYNNPFDGYVDDMRIYDRALTQTEISDLASGGCGPNVTAPVVTSASASATSGGGATPTQTLTDTGLTVGAICSLALTILSAAITIRLVPKSTK